MNELMKYIDYCLVEVNGINNLELLIKYIKKSSPLTADITGNRVQSYQNMDKILL